MGFYHIHLTGGQEDAEVELHDDKHEIVAYGHLDVHDLPLTIGMRLDVALVIDEIPSDDDAEEPA